MPEPRPIDVVKESLDRIRDTCSELDVEEYIVTIDALRGTADWMERDLHRYATRTVIADEAQYWDDRIEQTEAELSIYKAERALGETSPEDLMARFAEETDGEAEA